MNYFFAFFNLIRWRNLLIVILTQWFVWKCVILPYSFWSFNGFFLDESNFLLLCLSTVLITASGYIINDYFDLRIDLINKPDKVIIERLIRRKSAILWHLFLNLAAIVISLYLARKMQIIWLPLIQVTCIVLLWFYSTTFKRMFISGNVVVSLLIGLTIVVLLLYEPSFYSLISMDYFIKIDQKNYVNPVWVIGVYAYFAFMLTWMREVVKDMEDFKGDAEEGCTTMPIRIGLKKTAVFVCVLGVSSLIPLVAAAMQLIQKEWRLLGWYLIIALIVPLKIWMFILFKKATSKHYSFMSRWLKLLMILGIGSLLIYYKMQYK